jgi:hypothetical protein
MFYQFLACLLLYRIVQIVASNKKKVLKMDSKDVKRRHRYVNYRIIVAFYRGTVGNIGYPQSGKPTLSQDGTVHKLSSFLAHYSGYLT